MVCLFEYASYDTYCRRIGILHCTIPTLVLVEHVLKFLSELALAFLPGFLGCSLLRNSGGIPAEPGVYCPRVPEHATVERRNQYRNQYRNQIGSVCAPFVIDHPIVTDPDAHIKPSNHRREIHHQRQNARITKYNALNLRCGGASITKTVRLY